MTATAPVQELNAYVLIYSLIPFRSLFATLDERHTYPAKWTNNFFEEYQILENILHDNLRKQILSLARQN